MTSGETTAAEGNDSDALAFNTMVAHQARMYDYMLGGKDNYAADRDAAEKWLTIEPGAAFSVRANRAFLGRAVRYLAGEAGMRQFLDIGTGIPTAGNTHEVAQSIAPESRILYVDYDPIVLAHARALLTSGDAGATEYIEADLRNTGKILEEARDFLDFTKPVGITLVAILHAIPDADDPHAIVARLLDAVPSGSYVALTHVGADLLDPETSAKLEGLSGQSMQQRVGFRDRAQVARFLDGTDPVDPGLVRAERWRPDPGADLTTESCLWAAVTRKR